jgi:hypothetical protein
VEKKLEEMEKDDIIEKTEGPTPWVSPIVVAPQPKSPNVNDVRICVDMRAVNKAIQRERHITPTIDDVIADLNDAKVFSKLDLIKVITNLNSQKNHATLPRLAPISA